MQTIDELVRLPWTWQGPTLRKEDDAEYWELRIAELRDFFVAGETRDEVVWEALPALRGFLDSYLSNGELPPLPQPTSWRLYIVDREQAGTRSRGPTFELPGKPVLT